MSNYISTPPHFVSGRLEKIGSHGHYLYTALRLANHVEIWSLHCLVPSSWNRIYTIRCHELCYCYFTFSIADDCVYALVIAIMDPDKSCQVLILRIDSNLIDAAAYVLSADCGKLFLNVSLESIGFGCGRQNGLYIYDKSMVMGLVPFWRIHLNDSESAFTITDCHIDQLEKEGSHKSMRFPTVLDGDRRLVLKITTDCKVAIFREDADGWLILQPNDSTDFDLSIISTRAITETFGRNWHRCGVIESPLSIFVDEDHCIFRIFYNNIHSFYRFQMDEENNTYSLQKCSRTKVKRQMHARFYMHCCAEGRRVIFVNNGLIGYVSIQPPTLKEIGFWAFQKVIGHLHLDENGFWSGGISEAKLREICHINKGLKLL